MNFHRFSDFISLSFKDFLFPLTTRKLRSIQFLIKKQPILSFFIILNTQHVVTPISTQNNISLLTKFITVICSEIPNKKQYRTNSLMAFKGQCNRYKFCWHLFVGILFDIYLYRINFSDIKWQIINIQLKRMDHHNAQKKYSKISPALKCYFLNSLYFKCMTIKDAASRCKLNYSTAKVIIRDLNNKERKYVKKIIKMKENQLKKGRLDLLQECCYRDIIEKEDFIKDHSESPNTAPIKPNFSIQVICRTAYDFFGRDERSNQQS